jgi:hypothetical protein
VLYPGGRKNSHFLASMDLRESGFKGHTYPGADGAWDRLVAEVDAFGAASVISHETFARCTPDQVRQAVGAFDTDDVRIVVTARDIARQIPSVWQERLKNRGTETYGEFLHEIFGSAQGRNRKGGFWLPQNLTALAERWMDVVGPDRFTLVTVPPPGADQDELWRRFTAATDVPPASYRLQVEGSNPSLGVVESELLRRMNPELADLPWPAYEVRVKRGFAERELATHSRSGKLTVPRDFHDEARAVGEQCVSFFGAAGCRVVGDLDDLRPRLSEEPSMHPDEVTTEEVLDLALGMLARSASRPRGLGGPGGARRELSGRLGTVVERARRETHRVRRRAARVRRGRRRG